MYPQEERVGSDISCLETAAFAHEGCVMSESFFESIFVSKSHESDRRREESKPERGKAKKQTIMSPCREAKRKMCCHFER